MTSLSRHLGLAGLPLVLGLGACASAAPGPMLLPAGWSPPAGQHCTPARAPKQLPGLGELTDSAALVRQLAGRSGYGLFTLGYDSLGVADTVRVAGGDLPRTERDGWARAIAASQRPESPLPPPLVRGRPQGWSVLLRVEAGNPATVQIGRSEHCAPVLSNRLAAASYLYQESQKFLQRYPYQSRPTRLYLRIRLDPAGRVTEATPFRSEGVPELNRIARESALRMQFLPARLNRIPVESTVVMPITFEFARR